MKLIIDTREQNELSFVDTDGVELVREALPVGDYTASHDNGILDNTVIERKSVADLFGSFSSNYEAERNKIIKAHTRGLKYILAIEASATEIRKGHIYWKDGEKREASKSGISQIRQLMTISRKYEVEVWFCQDRKDMAFRIMEYFLSGEKLAKTSLLPSLEKNTTGC